MEPPRNIQANQTTKQQRERSAYTSPSMTVRPNKSATEAGMTPAQRKAILEEENRFARSFGQRYEIAGVVDTNGVLNPRGNPMVTKSTGREAQHGTSTSVSTRNDRTRGEDLTFTHFHPWDSRAGSGLASRVGISFSGADIANAISRNNQGTRARTANYIFSIRKPAGGWNADPSEVRSYWNRAYSREQQSLKNQIQRLNQTRGLTMEEYNVRLGRLNTLASHRATKATADKYGFIYTRRKAD